MPILNVQIMQGHSAAQKTSLLKNCSQAVVDSIAAPLPSVRIVLNEAAPEHVIVAGEIGKAMALVLVGLIEGRTDEKKAALIAALNRAVEESIGISGQDIRVIITDVPKTDMGVAGGITALAAGR
ncbi:tautomerase family protein [Bordetella sp. BOR01]|uniref:tautomerase family protein n=1 Tax=Bordetella sp. BOR01 TaxID=2854779 RepID=UPI001C45F3B3|nr:tautomerase family protein [Bordetella sp. BOR01]MBV7486948.1 tautomerase family protein [Bordetella sp. BOR01]